MKRTTLFALIGSIVLCAGVAALAQLGDGDIGVKDLLILLGNWGPCP